MLWQELESDQRREQINTQQRFSAWRAARSRARGFRGSLIWQNSKGADYFVRASYEPRGGRRQRSLGLRTPETETEKREWEAARELAKAQLTEMTASLSRQASINRALNLGRMPLLGARIVRAIDDAGLLGNGLRIVGTNAI